MCSLYVLLNDRRLSIFYNVVVKATAKRAARDTGASGTATTTKTTRIGLPYYTSDGVLISVSEFSYNPGEAITFVVHHIKC